MPIFEYRCLECRKRSTILTLKPTKDSAQYIHCKSHNVEKIMSRFASNKSEAIRSDALIDPSRLGDFDESMGGCCESGEE